MRSLARIGAVAAAAAMALGFAGAGRAAAETVVKVGMPLAMSGPVAEIGQSVYRGASLYAKLHNSDLPKSVSVQLILRDDGGSSDNIRRIAQELIVRDRVQLLAGAALSPQAFTLAPLVTQAKIPLVVLNASTASITRKSPYIVRFSETLWQTSYTMGQWAAKKGHKKTYVLVSDYAAGRDAEAAYTKAFTAAGGKIVGSVHTPMAASDYLPYMADIKKSGADSVFMFVNAGHLDGAMKAFAGSGLKAAGVQLLGPGDIAIDGEIAKMSDDVLGLVTAGIYLVDNGRPQNAKFVAEYKKAYGPDELPNFMAAAGWDGMAAIYGLVEKTKGQFTGQQAMDFLSHWKDPDAPRGPIAVDPKTRDLIQTVYMSKVEKVDGKPTSVVIDKIPNVKDPWKELNPPGK
jgi:branched-chain amino acid transport system substrate-binding protein